MAQVQQISSAYSQGTGVTGVEVTKPASIQVGDLLIAHIHIEDTTDRINSAPSGWTRIINATVGPRAIRQYVYWKIVGSSEPDTYTWGMNASDEIIGMISAYRGVNRSSPIGNYATSTSTAASASCTAPAITVQDAGNALVHVCGNAYGSASYGAPTNFIQRVTTRTGSLSANISAAMFDRLSGVVAGSTGTVTSTAANSDYFVASLIEIVADRIEAVGNISSSEGFGAARLIAVILAAGAIVSAEAHGTPRLAAIQLKPQSCLSGEAFGSPALQGIVLSAGGIASAEAAGSPAIVGHIQGSGAVASAEAFGTLVLAGPIAPSGIASGEAVGTPSFGGPIAASGIGSSEAFGSPMVVNYPYRICGGINSAEAFGTPLLYEVSGIYPAGAIASAEAFGTAILVAGVAATSIESGEALGTPSLQGPIQPSAIASAEAIGAAIVYAKEKCGAIPTGEAFGSATVVGGPGTIIQAAGAIPSGEALGEPFLAAFDIVGAGGIAGAEDFGTLYIRLKRKCGDISSLEAFGSATVQTAAPRIYLQERAIASAETFGTPALQGPIQASGIASLEAFGYQWVYEINYCGNIESAEAFGAAAVVGSYSSQIRSISGIASAESVNSPRVVGEISTYVIATGYASGAVSLLGIIKPAAIESEEAVGTPGSAQANILCSAIEAPANGGFGNHDAGNSPYLIPVIATAVTGAGRIFPPNLFGTAVIVGTIAPSAIDTAEAVGGPLVRISPIYPPSIASAEAFGSVALVGKISVDYDYGIGSAEAFADTNLVWDKVWITEMVIELYSRIVDEIELSSGIYDSIELYSRIGGK